MVDQFQKMSDVSSSSFDCLCNISCERHSVYEQDLCNAHLHCVQNLQNDRARCRGPVLWQKQTYYLKVGAAVNRDNYKTLP